MTAAIRFSNVSKQYRGARVYRSLREDIRGLGRRRSPRAPIVALDDVTFDIRHGESTAILGLNGAGKTTALKLMCRIAYPTAGRIEVAGRIGALIEVGTGMHPELTGRENVRLYGTIMGLSGDDVSRRFDEIVDFAGIESAIDQPVKQYSSGMQLRLGFSIAAHLEPDILVVDEAISVGDAGFQHRCVQRISQLVRQGLTLIFVSHDLSAVETLCTRALLLSDGALVHDAPAPEVVRSYYEAVHAAQVAESEATVSGDDLSFDRVVTVDEHGTESTELPVDRPLTVRIHYRADAPISSPIFTVGISEGSAKCLAMASMLADGQTPDVIEGEGVIECTFMELPLQPRAYDIWGSVRGSAGYGDIIDWQRLCSFRVIGESASKGIGGVEVAMRAPIRLAYRWNQ